MHRIIVLPFEPGQLCEKRFLPDELSASLSDMPSPYDVIDNENEEASERERMVKLLEKTQCVMKKLRNRLESELEWQQSIRNKVKRERVQLSSSSPKCVPPNKRLGEQRAHRALQREVAQTKLKSLAQVIRANP